MASTRVRYQRLWAMAPVIALSLIAAAAQAEEPRRRPVIIDTDIGTNIEDAFALGLALASPELEVLGVTTVGQDAGDRAWLACRFITQCGRDKIAVAAGTEPQPPGKLDGQIQYRRHPAAIFNRTLKPVNKPGSDLLFELLSGRQGEVTIVCLGPLTNVAKLLKDNEEAKGWISQIVWRCTPHESDSGGHVDFENCKLDTAAAEAVLKSGVKLVIVPAGNKHSPVFDPESQAKLFASHRPMAFQLQNLFELHEKPLPRVTDPLAVAVAAGKYADKVSGACVAVGGEGFLLAMEGTENCKLLGAIDPVEAMSHYLERLSNDGEITLPEPPKNRATLVERGGFPAHVHVAEDYDNDIERRWWMSGKGETADTPQGGIRSQRAVLTQDFDDRQGDVKTMYRAVVFNPVPGPPMGKNTRLSFRYKLIGTDTMRVQLYSLSNGYHRYLSVDGLPQDRWESGAVDMTQMRRPDGSGGPLAADERIDDIQFYVDPRATVLIDDVVLYDAAPAEEKRPFPRRIVFTGWFDTGKQGQEWPGLFKIEPHEKPQTWKFAQSVIADGGGQLNVGLRGVRRLDQTTAVTFKHRLVGADRLRIELALKGRPIATADLTGLPANEWRETTHRFELRGGSDTPLEVDEVRFATPEKGQLSLDDLLIYTP